MGKPRGQEPPYPDVNYSWYVVGVLMLAYTFSFIDRQILSLLVLPIRRDLAITDTQMSLLHGLAFAIFYTFLGLPIGRIVDSRSRRKVIIIGITIWSLMTAACGLTNRFVTLFLARMGVGVGEATLNPAAYSLIADYFPKEKQGRALGVYGIGIYMGAGLAFIVGGLVIKWTMTTPTIDLPAVGTIKAWQLVFFIVGLPGLLIALLMLTIKEPYRRGVEVQGADSIPLAEVARYYRLNLRTFITHNFGFSLLALLGYGTAAWMPTFMARKHGWMPGDFAPYYGLIIMFAGTAGVVFGGWLTDRFIRNGRTDGAMRTGIICALGTLLPGTLATIVADWQTALSLITLGTFFSAFAWGAGPAAVQRVTPNRMRGQISAVYLFVVNIIGLGLGPTAMALVSDKIYGTDQAIGLGMAWISGIACVLATLLFLYGLKPYRESVARADELEAKQTT